MADSRFADAFARLPDYLGGHVGVSLTALALGLAVSLPLAILSRKRPRLRNTLLGFASVVQTIPGLALLTLFYPLLLALAALSQQVTGYGFSALGFLPAVLALALYSMLPVLRNTIAGLDGVDTKLHDAGRALALTRPQIFRHIDLPIAMPVIMAGIRTAAVWVIGTATLSTPIGQASLGNYIFAGLQTQNWVFVLFGCVAAAALAIAVDQLLAVIERGVAVRHRGQVIGGLCGIVLIASLALLPALTRTHGSAGSYVIGTKPFTEQYVLAALMEQRLNAAGLRTSRRDGLGSTVILNALANGEIDVYVDYSGTLWANQLRRSDTPPAATMLNEIGVWLYRERGISLLGTLGFENAYALIVKGGVDSIEQLASWSSQLTIAGDYEFFSRPEWRQLREAYGLNFRAQREMQAEFMYPALRDGQVDVIAGYSSDGQIAQYGLTVLADPKHAIPPYDAVLLISPKRANDARLLDALKPLVGAIDVEMMRAANLRATNGGNDGTAEAVARWLSDQIGKPK